MSNMFNKMFCTNLFAGHAAHVFLAMLLGIPVLQHGLTCEACTTQAMTTPKELDAHAVHLAGCRNVTHPRHNRIRSVLSALLRSAVPHADVVTERHVDAAGFPTAPVETGKGPALRSVDLAYQTPDSSTWRCYDIVVGSVLPAVAQRLVHEAPQPAQRHSALARNARRLKELTLERRAVDRYVSPLAFGAFGGLDPPTYRALSAMAAAVAAAGGYTALSTIIGRVQFAIWHKLVHQVVRIRTGGAIRGPPPERHRRPRGRPPRVRPLLPASPTTPLRGPAVSVGTYDSMADSDVPSHVHVPPQHAQSDGPPPTQKPRKRGRPPIAVIATAGGPPKRTPTIRNKAMDRPPAPPRRNRSHRRSAPSPVNQPCPSIELQPHNIAEAAGVSPTSAPSSLTNFTYDENCFTEPCGADRAL